MTLLIEETRFFIKLAQTHFEILYFNQQITDEEYTYLHWLIEVIRETQEL